MIIDADNDPNKDLLRAALSAGHRWRDEGREVSIESPRDVKDWNDVLGKRLMTPWVVAPIRRGD